MRQNNGLQKCNLFANVLSSFILTRKKINVKYIKNLCSLKLVLLINYLITNYLIKYLIN